VSVTALGSPRCVVEAHDHEADFRDRLDRLLKELREYRDPGGTLAGLDLNDQGVRQLVEANIQLTQLQQQAALLLPATKTPEVPALLETKVEEALLVEVEPAKSLPAPVETLLRDLWRECLSGQDATEARTRLEGLAQLYNVSEETLAAIGREVEAEKGPI